MKRLVGRDDPIAMAIVERERPTNRKRTAIYVSVAAVVVFLLVAGVAFANSVSVTRVTNNARDLHWTNAVAGTAALTRAGLAQAVTFAELESESIIATGDFQFAMDQVRTSSDELEHLRDLGIDFDSYPELTRYIAAVGPAIASLETGDVDTAKQIVQTSVERAYSALSDAVSEQQQDVQAAIDDNSRAGRQLNGLVVFILTLGVPGAAVAIYFVVARRQVKAFRARAQLEIEAEREIGRAKDSFIAGLSHELRTPLTSIYGFAEVLGDGDVSGFEATQETARIIANEAAEMTRMVDDLLVASRLESTGIEIEKTATPVDGVIESAVAPFEKAGCLIRRETTNTLADVDAPRLRHVLVNLISNAARHGGPGIAIEVSETEESVSIEVSDGGAGVPPELKERLFQRFLHSGDQPLLTGSIGLGLAVAARLTDLMGGSLAYQRFNTRTYFVVTLPSVVAREADGESDSVASIIRAMSA